MPVIHLATAIRAPRERVFDLARSIDAHRATAPGTAERAVAGVTRGLLGPGEDVTWEARHLGIRQRLTVRMTEYDRPSHFRDVLIEGAFARLIHDHSFEEKNGGTLMRDRFEFDAPFGLLGAIAEFVFLTAYLRRFLEKRNQLLKETAESDGWEKYVAVEFGGGVPSPRG